MVNGQAPLDVPRDCNLQADNLARTRYRFCTRRSNRRMAPWRSHSSGFCRSPFEGSKSSSWPCRASCRTAPRYVKLRCRLLLAALSLIHAIRAIRHRSMEIEAWRSFCLSRHLMLLNSQGTPGVTHRARDAATAHCHCASVQTGACKCVSCVCACVSVCMCACACVCVKVCDMQRCSQGYVYMGSWAPKGTPHVSPLKRRQSFS